MKKWINNETKPVDYQDVYLHEGRDSLMQLYWEYAHFPPWSMFPSFHIDWLAKNSNCSSSETN